MLFWLFVRIFPLYHVAGIAAWPGVVYEPLQDTFLKMNWFPGSSYFYLSDDGSSVSCVFPDYFFFFCCGDSAFSNLCKKKIVIKLPCLLAWNAVLTHLQEPADWQHLCIFTNYWLNHPCADTIIPMSYPHCSQCFLKIIAGIKCSNVICIVF